MVDGRWAVIAQNTVVSSSPTREWIAFVGDWEEAKREGWELVKAGYRVQLVPDEETLRDGEGMGGAGNPEQGGE